MFTILFLICVREVELNISRIATSSSAKKDTCKCGECFKILENNPDLKIAVGIFKTSLANLSKEAQDIKLFTMLRDMRRDEVLVNMDRPTGKEHFITINKNILNMNNTSQCAPQLCCWSTFAR